MPSPLPALLTGAGRGLGAAVAEALAPARHVVAVARVVGALEELDDRIRARGGQARLAPMDVADDSATQALQRGCHDHWGDPGELSPNRGPSLGARAARGSQDLARTVEVDLAPRRAS